MRKGQWVVYNNQVGIINNITPQGIEFHPIEDNGTTKLRVIEDSKGLHVVTDVLIIQENEALELLERGDKRIPASRRVNAE